MHRLGRYPLDLGLLSVDGWAVVNDSAAVAMEFDLSTTHIEDAWVDPRPRTGNDDFYIFGCGDRYRACLEVRARQSLAKMIPQLTTACQRRSAALESSKTESPALRCSAILSARHTRKAV